MKKIIIVFSLFLASCEKTDEARFSGDLVIVESWISKSGNVYKIRAFNSNLNSFTYQTDEKFTVGDTLFIGNFNEKHICK